MRLLELKIHYVCFHLNIPCQKWAYYYAQVHLTELYIQPSIEKKQYVLSGKLKVAAGREVFFLE